MEIKKIFNVLNQYNVKYLVCGGLAVNIYGIPRMTADIDLLLDFDEANILNFENATKQLLFQSVIPLSINEFVKKEDRIKIKQERNLIAYSYFNSLAGYMNLDVLLDVPIEFDILWRNKTERLLGHTVIYLVSVEDLIELKRYANRIQDQNDILLLSKLIKNGR
ncbi:MAG: nucleotidyl transferase AbiEii/AbiGii toxin family protein [Bacteroidetes bacterium]|nr:nucleotidyl transferase AbiEii/AbiGii toxin family protein [Bacteroidota bacterium]